MLARGKGDLETSGFDRAWKQAGVSCSVRSVEKSARGDSAAGIASRKSNPYGSRTDRYARLARSLWPPSNSLWNRFWPSRIVNAEYAQSYGDCVTSDILKEIVSTSQQVVGVCTHRHWYRLFFFGSAIL